MISSQQSIPHRPHRRILFLLFALLGVYSAILLTIELTTSQDHVRHFFTDITGEVPFHAVNTTLSVMMLWAASLLFAVAAHLPATSHRHNGRWWFWSQAAVFFYLGFDDRFLLHELLSRHLRVGDHYVLLGVAIVELCLLYYGWRERLIPMVAQQCLQVAALLFAAMWLIDGFAPHDLAMRLSTEDLCKTWSCFFFARYAWVTLFSRISTTANAHGDKADWRDNFQRRHTALPVEVEG